MLEVIALIDIGSATLILSKDLTKEMGMQIMSKMNVDPSSDRRRREGLHRNGSS